MRKPQARQSGAALIMFLVTVLLGFAWFVYNALEGTGNRPAEREQATAQALESAKRALLAWVAKNAADSAEATPGRLPCPEVRSQASPGNANEGVAGPFAGIACDAVGRLPWRTLGVDQIRDGSGQPLWLAVPLDTWARRNVGDALTINPASANQIGYDGVANAVVAVIIAPGDALNTNPEAGTPAPGCSRVNQLVANGRYSAVAWGGGNPFVPANFAPVNFMECGNAGGSYTTIGTAPWSNDRTISITAREVIEAIAGPVADRLQREVAPALNDWRSTQSLANWGRAYLPYASSFTLPASNDLVGNGTTTEGLLPAASSTASAATSWTGGTVTALGGIVFGTNCVQTGTEMQCTYSGVIFSLLGGLLGARVTATAPDIARTFRAPITAANVSVAPAGATVSNFSLSLSQATGDATISFDVSRNILGFTIVNTTVRFPNVPDAALLSDPRMAWFLNNDWTRYTYYAFSPAVSVNPGGNTCPVAGGAQCLTVNGLDASTGLANDKTFALALTGPALATQTQPSASPTDYLESHTVGTSLFTAAPVSSTYNDRLVACPFQQTPAAGGPLILCN